VADEACRYHYRRHYGRHDPAAWPGGSMIPRGNATCGQDSAYDETAQYGPNCILCNCDSEQANGLRFIRQINPSAVEGVGFVKPKNGKTYYEDCARTKKEGANVKYMCVQLNRRLRPREDALGPWLRWDDPLGTHPAGDRAPRDGDIPIGRSGARTLYVDARQPDRFAEFALFIAVAAGSSTSPSASTKGRGAMAISATVPESFVALPRR
jgi:hypothetical protein